jgi:hypothetical protein
MAMADYYAFATEVECGQHGGAKGEGNAVVVGGYEVAYYEGLDGDEEADTDVAEGGSSARVAIVWGWR